MKYTIALSCSILFILLNTTSCFKERTCRDKAPLTAAFKIEEEIGYFSSFYGSERYDFITNQVRSTGGSYYSETDTIIAGSMVHFTALGEADRYEWTVGSDPRTFEGKHFNLRFFGGVDYDSFTPTSVGITLRAFRNNPECFPEDTFAVQHREMVAVPLQQSALLGQYRGSSTRFPEEMHNMEIMYSAAARRSSVDNFPKDCTAIIDGLSDTLRGASCVIGYKGFVVMGGGFSYGIENCYRTLAIGELDDNHQLRIEYCLDAEAGGHAPLEETDFVYEGMKIQ